METCCLKTMADIGALRARDALEAAKGAMAQAGDGGGAPADFRHLLEDAAESLRDAEGSLLNASDLAAEWLCPRASLDAPSEAEACRMLLEERAVGLPERRGRRQAPPPGAEECRKLLEERAVGLPGRPCRSPLLPLDGELVRLRSEWLELRERERRTPALKAAAAYADALERKLSSRA